MILAVNTGARISECQIKRQGAKFYVFPLRDLGAADQPTQSPPWVPGHRRQPDWFVTTAVGLAARTGNNARTWLETHQK